MRTEFTFEVWYSSCVLLIKLWCVLNDAISSMYGKHVRLHKYSPSWVNFVQENRFVWPLFFVKKDFAGASQQNAKILMGIISLLIGSPLVNNVYASFPKS